jgi:8-oxo-dGTP diphosphatase
MRVIHVVAGLLMRDTRVLLDRRRAGTHLEGLWEFPGGKREAHETDAEALVRELREELDVHVTAVEPELARVQHVYPELDLTLVLYPVHWEGEPVAREVAEVRWFPLSELTSLPMPPADGPLLEAVLAREAGRRR